MRKMVEVIEAVRWLIGDPAGDCAALDDMRIEAALDRHREIVRGEVLTALPTYEDGVLTYYEHAAQSGHFEADAKLLGPAMETLTPTTADTRSGRWTFADGQDPPVRVFGRRYDVYAAAADLLEQWAGIEKLSFDVEADGMRLSRSQKAKALLELARTYRAQQRPVMATLVRDDDE